MILHNDYSDTIPVLPHRLTDADVQRYRQHQGDDVPDSHDAARDRDYDDGAAGELRGMQMLAAVLLVALCAAVVLTLVRAA